MIDFWLSFVVAWLLGLVHPVSGISAMTSDNPTPVVQEIYEWPGDPFNFSDTDDEMYYVIIENGKIIETGP